MDMTWWQRWYYRRLQHSYREQACKLYKQLKNTPTHENWIYTNHAPALINRLHKVMNTPVSVLRLGGLGEGLVAALNQEIQRFEQQHPTHYLWEWWHKFTLRHWLNTMSVFDTVASNACVYKWEKNATPQQWTHILNKIEDYEVHHWWGKRLLWSTHEINGSAYLNRWMPIWTTRDDMLPVFLCWLCAREHDKEKVGQRAKVLCDIWEEHNPKHMQATQRILWWITEYDKMSSSMLGWFVTRHHRMVLVQIEHFERLIREYHTHHDDALEHWDVAPHLYV